MKKMNVKPNVIFFAIAAFIVILLAAFLIKGTITGNVVKEVHDSEINTANAENENGINSITGKATYDTYTGFSNPGSRFSVNIRNITFENDSDIAYVTFTVKDYLVYGKGYLSLDGQDWVEFTLTPIGESLDDGWIKYGATATVAMNKNALRLSDTRTETSENYAIVYTCSVVNKTWDCHDGWQIIDFRAQFKKRPSAPNNNTNVSNNTGSGTGGSTGGTDGTSGGSTGGSGTNTTNTTSTNSTKNTTNSTSPAPANTTIDPAVLAYCKQVCDHIIYPEQTYVRGYQIGNISPGDTICFPAGIRKSISILNTRGSQSDPITITNCGGQAILDGTGQTGHGIWLQNVSYFRLTGTGDSNFKYGIKIINSDSSGVAASGRSTDMEIDHLEIANAGFAGLLLKTDPGCDLKASRHNFIQYNTLAHDNYIHDVEGEGIYLGSSFFLGGHSSKCNNVTFTASPDPSNTGLPTSPNYYAIVKDSGWKCEQIGTSSGAVVQNQTLVRFNVQGSSVNYEAKYSGAPLTISGSSMKCSNVSLNILPHEARGVRVYNNVFQNTGWDCLQVGSATSDVEIYNNSLIGCGMEGVYGQTLAMQINPGTTGKVYNNYIEGGAHGIQLQGSGDNVLFNNIIYNSMGDGIITTGDANAIRPGKGYHIENNLIVNPIRYGVYIITSATTGSTIRNNIIIGGQQTIRAGSSTIASSVISNNLNSSNISYYQFVDAGSKNYRSTANSPMVNAGTPTSDWFVFNDRDGVSRPQASSYDIGPYEYISGAIPDQDSDGYTTDDCNNANPGINPGAAEICGNGIDENCDLTDAVCPVIAVDKDSDGYNSTTDCNDSNSTIWTLMTGYADSDGDGYTLAASQVCSGNSLPSGYKNTTAGTDCADKNSNINPSKIEICGNNIDEDCSGADLSCPAPSSNGDVCDTSVTVNACHSHFKRLQTIVDGDYATYDDSWNYCTSSPEWWQFTFQNAKTINTINFLERNFADGWIATSPSYYIEYLDSNNQWKQVSNIKKNPNNVAGSFVGTSWNNVSFDNITTTSFRLMVYAGGSATFTGLAEVECFARPSANVIPAPTCSDGIQNGNETGVDCGGAQCAACFIDSDGDGYNNANDCNDNNAAVWTLRTGYADADNDAYTVGSSQQICSGASLPAGYRSSSSGTDCNDNNANINPGKVEVCGNGIDEDCSGSDLTCTVTPPAATCTDGVMNGAETGIDCGGTCANNCSSLLTTGRKGTQHLFNVSGSGITGYILYLPPNYNPANDYPVMIFLHGAGEKFSGGYLNYTLLRRTAIPQLINNGYDLPFIVIMPQVGTTGDWNYNSLSKVVTVLDSVATNYSVDATRIYVTGLSMGGGGTNKFVEEYYQLPAAAVPIAGWGSVTCANTEKIPRWSFHNNIDTTVASSGSRNVYNSHKKCAGAIDPRLSIYNASGHDSWSKTYNLNGMYDVMQNGTGSINYTEEIYKWFMRYSRPELAGTTCFTCIVDYDNDGAKMKQDCNDGNASINPSAEEICGNTVDENCDGIKAGACPVAAVDADSDGYNSTADCNDNNANVNPGKTEVCGNGLDDDCSAGDATCQAAPTCSDGIMNGDESGVDCGGSCQATCIASSPAPSSGLNGLLVSYPFTTNANDDSGNSRHGIVSGATWSSLSSSGIYSFDGNDYITVTGGGELDGLAALSVEVWVYNPNFTGSNEYIIGKRKDVNASWGLYVETSSTSFMFFINDTAKNIKAPATLEQWQYITATWDGSTMKIYSNGVMTSSMSFGNNMNVFPASNVLVGARESPTGRTLHYNGKIGEVHIYNKALSASEIQSRYDSTKVKYS